MDAADPSHPSALPRAYAAWRRRFLAGAILATAVGLVMHGPTGEFRYESGEWPSPWLLLGLVAVVVGAFGPGLVGACLALTAVWSWRRLGPSCRLARAAWVVWVLGPFPLLLLPVAHLFNLDLEDSLKTSATQLRYLLTVTAPALFALFPGTLNAALVLERFLPESRVPGQITLLAAPACAVAYLLPLAVLAQLAFQWELYLGLLLLACSPLVPLLAVRWLLRRDPPSRAARLVRTIGLTQGALAALGVLLIVRWLGEHPSLRAFLGQINPVWVLGLVAKVLASKWLTTVVVTDLLLSMLHQSRQSARALADTAEGEALAQKLDALGHSLWPAGPPTVEPGGATSGRSNRSGLLSFMKPAPGEFALPLDVLERLDRVCKRFEDHWRAGEVPRILDYLSGFDGAERRLLFRELLYTDAELRQARGLPSSLAAYGSQFPEYRDLLETLALPNLLPEP